ncbi:hypothetical protein EW145_g6089 [Phellinidium pouzarii]|uniref:Glucose-methanol-choline oxidoreductase N-terminal domain-containing protein n=1 Tax=Phellinidium pouzarii TaxID=167371 RepID=A0A4S4KZK4_9AGAM|nr:hypothetical protein EW145_g6089 [Phellinidium pouzarii]
MSAALLEISGMSFDYVVIGGGTTGLTVAARLAENPHITVAVLEAGSERLNDPLINIPAQFGKHFGDSRYDWNVNTVPQEHANGRSFAWPSGKVLGGSSAINFFTWSNPPSQDIDDWERLGNPGWNWSRFSASLKKTESLTAPSEEIATKYRQVFNPEAYGTSGPLKTSFPSTLLNTGIKVSKDPHNGDPIGTSMLPCTIDSKTFTRSYAATAFYEPNANKPNFYVLCNALVHRILTKEPRSNDLSVKVEAEAVEFEYDGKIHLVYAAKEIILSAGALMSPRILELSGVGDKRILDSLGIKTIIDLPGVGSNLQEHIFGVVIFEVDPSLGYKTLDLLADEDYAAAQLKLHAEGQGLFRINLLSYSFLPLSSVASPEDARRLIARQRRSIEERLEDGKLPPGLKEQWMMQLAEYENGTSGDCELVYFPGYFGGAPEKGTFISIYFASNHLFSRGTIHVVSTDPHIQPSADPHYFEEEIDIEVMTETVKFIRSLPDIEPFKNMVVREVVPGTSCSTTEEIREFIKGSFTTTFHTVGTLSMLPRSQNGVVDPNLRIYGSKNIRVADTSIVPLHIAAHTQSTAYAIGEQAAEIIIGHIPEVPPTDMIF